MYEVFKIIISFQGLEDESAICVRHTMTGVEICLPILLSSKDSREAVSLLHAVADLTNNPYWLIKVIYCFLRRCCCNLFIVLHYLVKNCFCLLFLGSYK